jgi:hypothetical protein
MSALALRRAVAIADGRLAVVKLRLSLCISGCAETMTTNSEAAIFRRVLEPEKPMLSPDAAHSILALDFTAEDRERMNALAAKAREGTLTSDEDEELENYLRVGDLLAIMQSKARRSLQNGEPGV